MAVDKLTVKKIATLAKLEFNEEQAVSIQQDLSRMLDFVNKLNEVDTEDVEPLVYMLNERPTLRKDEPLQEISQQEALKNAPDKDTDFFKVPKVIKR
ncbi:MAG: Asp-tRNA(Asn)/Glu-tRNA(Gln) amidotransferase subunit GatC [Vicingaceae bacterium]|jgi:aspartyl-tRNA(Asn)/glutamyl-tRNA(Gln) amidotransferase subunit C|nr:Asp-tRNA(Asn)/Glu-tRNA(Gln) amidotransferase subunit GatC [Flavobacteriales bacterium]MBQ19455.1 Asp-tRNA(Asn)/Glu-tRNA(Gln) amidotransferase GatCAB subunit C [Flavobacteriales bacterium]MCW9041127.1 Asp-tRNA(Asn)/Glu-tRNA(Gln) amidotransferase subunit GatC [Flavobacteriales bacterium]MDF1674560.1 Asp-tRNA(Asn)/Glu-tRNA(Gln) amidotransferase subunit GatC [Vicingaceae bacterium]|tara:strand:+ start:160422 stop:160712 length:291 start_codon:yes stop_codon:yes gene_type:complete